MSHKQNHRIQLLIQPIWDAWMRFGSHHTLRSECYDGIQDYDESTSSDSCQHSQEVQD